LLLLLSAGVACDSGPTLESKAKQAEAENRREDALKLYQRACEKDVFTSCLRLGSLLAQGVGAPKNEAEALKALLRACEAQLAEGCSEAASVLARTPADVARAQELDQKACTLGRQASCIEWSRRVIEALGDKVSEASPEQLKDYERALTLLRGGCDAGEQRGCELLCSKTKGSDQQACGAACDKGSASACHALAQTHLKSDKRDLKSAQPLEVKACEGGEAAACLTLVRGVLRGWFKGVQPTKVLVKRACELGDCSAACEQGDAQACLSESKRLASKEAPAAREASEAYAATACRRGVLAACKGQSQGALAPGTAEAGDEPFELMRGVCGTEPLRFRVEGAEQDTLACPRCPLAFAASDARAPSFSEAALGSFVEANRREALVALEGCEGYEFSGVTRGTFGRRVLLAHVDGKWKQVRYYPTNTPMLGKATLKLRSSDGTDFLLSDEGPGCHMGGCTLVMKLTYLTYKKIEQKGVLTSEYDESQWSWSAPTQSEDGTVRIMLFPKEGEGEHIIEWKWEGDDLTVQKDQVSSSPERGVKAKTAAGSWRAARSYD
jgi:TPR repeat protein